MEPSPVDTYNDDKAVVDWIAAMHRHSSQKKIKVYRKIETSTCASIYGSYLRLLPIGQVCFFVYRVDLMINFSLK